MSSFPHPTSPPHIVDQRVRLLFEMRSTHWRRGSPRYLDALCRVHRYEGSRFHRQWPQMYELRISQDGNLYVLTSKGISVISQSGDLVRRIRFEKPDPKSIALNLYASGGLAVVVLGKIEANRMVKKEFLALD